MKNLLLFISTIGFIISCGESFKIQNDSGTEATVAGETLANEQCRELSSGWLGDFPLTIKVGDAAEQTVDEEGNYRINPDGTATKLGEGEELQCGDKTPTESSTAEPTAGEGEESAAPAGGGTPPAAAGELPALSEGGSDTSTADTAQEQAIQKLRTIIAIKKEDLAQLEKDYNLDRIAPFPLAWKDSTLARHQRRINKIDRAEREIEQLELELEVKEENLRRSIDQ